MVLLNKKTKKESCTPKDYKLLKRPQDIAFPKITMIGMISLKTKFKQEFDGLCNIYPAVFKDTNKYDVNVINAIIV